MLRYARRRAVLTQRALAERSGVPQSTIGRIEAGTVDPRFSTLRHLLRACGFDLEVEPVLGFGVDRSLFPPLVAMAPERRIATLEQSVPDLLNLREAMRVSRSAPR